VPGRKGHLLFAPWQTMRKKENLPEEKRGGAFKTGLGSIIRRNPVYDNSNCKMGEKNLSKKGAKRRRETKADGNYHPTLSELSHHVEKTPVKKQFKGLKNR